MDHFETEMSRDFTEQDVNSATSLEPIPMPVVQLEDDAPLQRRVLVLEDDPVQRQILKSYLDSMRLEVLEANSVANAQEQIVANPNIELCLLDIHVPDGSGLDFCEQLDDDPRFTDIPKIILSSLTDPSVVRRTRASGGCYFIGKPYDPNVLLAIIERALGEDRF